MAYDGQDHFAPPLPLERPTVYRPDLKTRERLEIAGMLAAQTRDILELIDRRLKEIKDDLLEAIKDHGKPD